MKTNEEMNMKPEEFTKEQLGQVTGGTADDTRCVNGLSKMETSVCQNCKHRDWKGNCMIGVEGRVCPVIRI